MSRVDLPDLAVAAVASSKQQEASSKQAATRANREKNQNPVVVICIWLKFWCMIPMGVKCNHTKFEQESQRWRPGTGFARADLRFKPCSLGPKTAIFGPQKPRNTFKTAKRRETVGTPHVRLDLPVSTSCLQPSNSMICPPEAPNAASHKPRIGDIPPLGAISLATWLKMRFRRHLFHPHPPTFCGFHPSNLPKRTPRPQYLGPLCCGKLQAQAQTGGCPNGSTGSSRGKKMTFLKNDPRPCATLKQVFLDCFELVVAHFGPPKSQNALKMGCLGTKNGSKMGQKRVFQTSS